MNKKVFIDGSAGTTGLRIVERLLDRDDLSLILLSDEIRKDPEARKAAFMEADIAFLCLPDAAAVEAAELAADADVVLIDTSTAHRTDPDWTYGFPEIAGLREKIAASKRIANPGCHASGFIALIAPLVEKGLLPPDGFLSCLSLTGYSGGGKKMIAEYEDADRDQLLEAPRLYGLSQQHKHIPEMVKVCGLKKTPAFHPVVAPYYAGMETVITLAADRIFGSAADVCGIYTEYYRTGLVHFEAQAAEGGFLSAGAFAGRDDMQLSVFGNEERITLTARFDNLGKGASGAAIQNMNLVLGLPETTGLCC